MEQDRWTRAEDCSESGCVEVFRKSSFSADNGDCVEVASVLCESNQCVTVETETTRLVRDSKLGDDSPVLRYTEKEWQAFIAGVKAGEFD